MRKHLIALAMALALAAVMIACGSGGTTNEYVPPVTEGTTAAEATSEGFAETETQAMASESTAQTEAETTFSAGTTTLAAATSTARAATTTKPAAAAPTAPAAATQATTRSTAPTTQSTTTTTRTTTTTTTTAAPQPQTQPPKPVYTEADYAEIVAIVRAYAESKALPFIWDTKLTYEYARSGMAGYHDVVSLNQNGKDGVIKTLKYNADQTEWLVTGGNGGVPSSEVHFNIVRVDYQGEPYFALIYG